MSLACQATTTSNRQLIKMSQLSIWPWANINVDFAVLYPCFHISVINHSRIKGGIYWPFLTCESHNFTAQPCDCANCLVRIDNGDDLFKSGNCVHFTRGKIAPHLGTRQQWSGMICTKENHICCSSGRDKHGSKNFVKAFTELHWNTNLLWEYHQLFFAGSRYTCPPIISHEMDVQRLCQQDNTKENGQMY